ncbi:MAG TPA: homoserine kinase [Actinomycetota bacterium]|nr:homoserine kinase [Actinomycetota bacterium]
MKLTARVPATSANLGPGFDCFGLALDLCNVVTIDTEAEPGVSWEGEGAAELPTDGTDMVSRAMRFAEAKVAEAHGPDIFVLRPFHLHGANRIPLARGLGSSAAAAVAGIALAYRLLDVADPGSLAGSAFSLASEMEGHPDNAAAAAFGGFTIVAGEEVERLEPHPDLRPVLLVPEHVRVPTDEARRVLPSTVSREDAVFNVGHAALTMARILHDPDGLRLAMADRLHQDVRLALVPEVREVFDRLHAANVPVCVSGSGPTLLAFERDRSPIADPGEGWRVLRVPVRRTGVEIVGA